MGFGEGVTDVGEGGVTEEGVEEDTDVGEGEWVGAKLYTSRLRRWSLIDEASSMQEFTVR